MEHVKGAQVAKNPVLSWFDQSEEYLLQNHIFYEENQIIIVWPDESLGVVAYENISLRDLTARQASDMVDLLQKEYGNRLANAVACVLYNFLVYGKIVVADFLSCVEETYRQMDRRNSFKLVRGALCKKTSERKPLT